MANLYTIRVGLVDARDKVWVRQRIWERIQTLRGSKMLRGHNLKHGHEIQAQVYCSWRTIPKIIDTINRIWVPRPKVNDEYPLIVKYVYDSRS